LHGLVTAADVQDRDGGILLLSTLFGMFPFLRKLFADGAYDGPVFHTALAAILPNLETEIVKRSDRLKGFVVLPPDGWSNARLVGSTAAAGSPRIGRTSITMPSRSSNGLPSASCYEGYAMLDKVSGRTLILQLVRRETGKE
jgi:hypothetical protein